MLTLSRRTVTALASSIGRSAMLGILSAPLLGSTAAESLPKSGSQGLAEFVSGNMLFELCHKIAHAAITQMGYPSLEGR
jgi:hypothetical protein